MMSLAEFIHCATGVPFVDGGRDYDGWDCWGLVRRAYNDVLRIDLPTYGEVSASDLRAVRRAFAEGAAVRETWRPVSDPQPLDVVGMRAASGAILAHVGLWLPGGMVMHVERASMTAREPANGIIMRSRIVGYWRHADA